MKMNTLFIGSLALALLFPSCQNKRSEQMPPVEVKSYPVQLLEPQNIELQSVFPAILKGLEDVELKPRVEGFIEAVYIDEGTEVKKGQPLFKINSPSSIKALEEAQAQYNTAKLNVERMRPLAEKKIISKVQLDSYQNALDAAKAALEQAKATLGWVTVTSPVDGIIGTISYRLGSLVNSNSILTTVSNTSKLVAYFSMNEKELYEFLLNLEGKTKDEKINSIPDVKFRMPNGILYEEPGRIETISGMVDPASGTVSLRAFFPNKNGILLSGTSGNVIVPKYMKEALVISQKSTFSQQDKILVYKVQADSTVLDAIRVKSTPDGLHYVVLEGLERGDQIVTDGIATLRNGQRINIQ
ncbi:MAG: efflux RND transporter periplasmic adaptor subunit [Bacteroidales bacterium]|nr:efflux RND transporter periplasmic adaptor subunit [Bacteroidales bacterium]